MQKLKIGKQTVETSNEEKIFFPNDGITKGKVIEYYRNIAETMLPYMKKRPINMHRFPDGIEGDSFYQHEISDYFPDWIDRAEIKKKEGGRIEHVVCNKQATLVYIANQACITPHIWLSRYDKPDYPDRLVFDLDPPDNDFDSVRFAAEELRNILEKKLELAVFLMTTGSSGLHIVIPLKRYGSFDEVRSFAQSVADLVVRNNPDILTTEVSKKNNRTKLLIDTSRNAYGQTVVAPYAVRAKQGAPIATPLRWDELSDKNIHSASFTMKNIFKRLAQVKDPWENLDKNRVSLKTAQKRMKKLLADQ